MSFKTQPINKGQPDPKTLLAQCMETELDGVAIVGVTKEGVFLALSNVTEKDLSHSITMIQHHLILSMRMSEVRGPGDIK